MDDRGLRLHQVVGQAGRGGVVGGGARAEELVARHRVDALGDVRLVRGVVHDRGRGVSARAVVAGRAELRAAGVVEREGLEVDDALAQAFLVGAGVEVAQEAGLAARADDRGGAAHQHAQLAPPHLIGGGAARRVDLGVTAQAAAPVVAVLVALAGVGVRRVLGKGDVIVGVDEARRHHAHRAGDHGLATHRAARADAGDGAGGVDADLAVGQRAGRREHGAGADEPRGTARGHGADVGRRWRVDPSGVGHRVGATVGGPVRAGVGDRRVDVAAGAVVATSDQSEDGRDRDRGDRAETTAHRPRTLHCAPRSWVWESARSGVDAVTA